MAVARKETKHTSFYLTPIVEDQLRYLARVFGENPSAVMRRLITETHTILKYVEQRK